MRTYKDIGKDIGKCEDIYEVSCVGVLTWEYMSDEGTYTAPATLRGRLEQEIRNFSYKDVIF